MSDPVPDESIEIILELTIQIGLVAAAGGEKERESCVLQAATHEVKLSFKVAFLLVFVRRLIIRACRWISVGSEEICVSRLL